MLGRRRRSLTIIIFLLAFFHLFLFDVTDCYQKSRRWNKSKLTWIFEDPYHFLTSHQFDKIRLLVNDAFDIWSAALDGLLEIGEFDEISHLNPDIRIYFAKRNHSCIESFDGTGGVVAHSTYPSNGMLHLDGDEHWHTGDSTKGDVDLRYVLVHEIGHVLGLRHSKKKGSVMRRNYRSTSQKMYKLSRYDIRAIRKLYMLSDNYHTSNRQ